MQTHRFRRSFIIKNQDGEGSLTPHCSDAKKKKKKSTSETTLILKNTVDFTSCMQYFISGAKLAKQVDGSILQRGNRRWLAD